MKLVRYGKVGKEMPGLIDADGKLRDLSDHVSDIAGDTLSDKVLAKLRKLDPASLPLVKGKQRMAACVGNIGKFLCIGLNYSDHAAETGAAIPEHPILFMKATSAVVGANDDVVLPRKSKSYALKDKGLATSTLTVKSKTVIDKALRFNPPVKPTPNFLCSSAHSIDTC